MELSKGFGTSGSGLNWELVLDWELQEEQSDQIVVDVSSYALEDYKLLMLKTFNFFDGNNTQENSTPTSLYLQFTENSTPTYSPRRSLIIGNLLSGAWTQNRHGSSVQTLALFAISKNDAQIYGFSSTSLSDNFYIIKYSGSEVGFYDGEYHKPSFKSIDTLSLSRSSFSSGPTVVFLPGAKIQIYGLN